MGDWGGGGRERETTLGRSKETRKVEFSLNYNKQKKGGEGRGGRRKTKDLHVNGNSRIWQVFAGHVQLTNH